MISLLKKRKVEEPTEVQETKIVENERDTIALGPLLLTGQQDGNFFVQDTLTLDTDAEIVGDVTATDCIINGKVIGNVICAKSLHLSATAVIQGSVMAKTAIIDTGCIINGTVLLAPRVEVTTLAVKIAEAESILKKEIKVPEYQNIIPDTQDVPVIKRATTPESTPSVKKQKDVIIPKINPIELETTKEEDTWW